MAPVVEAIAAVVAYIWPAATTIAYGTVTYATIIAYAIVVSAAIAYSSAQQNKLKGASGQSDTGRDVMVRDPVAPRRCIYGEIMCSGTITYMSVTGTNNKFLNVNLVLASHECDTLGELYFDNMEHVPLDGSGNATGKYAGFFTAKKHVGTATQAADTDLIAADPANWTSNHKGEGLAYLYMKFTYNSDLFPNGLPTVLCLVKGKKVFDPRDGTQNSATPSTWKWSQNPVLCVADFLHDGYFGKKIPWARINTAEMPAEATTCEDAITLITGTENRYNLNGSFTTNMSKDQVLTDMLASMAGCVVDTGGYWTILAGQYRSVTAATLTDDDFISAFQVQPRASMKDTFSGCKGTFYSPDNSWQPADFVPWVNSAYTTLDGGILRWNDVTFGFVISNWQAQRLAKIAVERGRQQCIVNVTCKLSVFGIRPGDNIALTRSILGWSAKVFEVLSWSFRVMGSGADLTLGIALTLKETASTVWGWTGASEVYVPPAAIPLTPDMSVVGTPSGLTLTNAAYLQTDGTSVPRISITWSASGNVFVDSGGFTLIEFKKHTDTAWILWSQIRGDLLADYLTDLVIGVGYDVRIRFQNGSGVRGPYSTITSFGVAGDTTAPATPSGLACSALAGLNYLTWTANTESDLMEYQIYRNTVNSFPGGTPIWRGRSVSFNDNGTVAGTTYYYWIISSDNTGNLSGASSSVNGTPTAGGGGGSGTLGYNATAGNTIGSTTDVVCSSVTVTLDANTHSFFCTMDVTNNGGSTKNCLFRLKRNGTVVGTISSITLVAGDGGPANGNMVDTPGAGTYTYTIEGHLNSAGGNFNVDATLTVI